ncbi:hypothetical protein ACFL59_15870, partial [Planctomycetota bacterium]
AETIEKRLRPFLTRLVDKGVERLRGDQRTVREALGEETVREITEAVERLEPTEDGVRAFFEQGASEELLSNVVYSGILEFVRRADLLGPFVDRIPVIGGLRRRILSGLREEFERRAEAQVRAFLKSFSKRAVERAVEFVLSPANRDKFKRMRLKLLDRALGRRVADLVPKQDRLERMREQAWKRLHRRLEETDRWLQEHEGLRERHGQRSLVELREEWGLPDLNDRFSDVITEQWLRFMHLDSVADWFDSHPLPPVGCRETS